MAVGLDPMHGLLKSMERNEMGRFLLKGRVWNGVAGSCVRISGGGAAKTAVAIKYHLRNSSVLLQEPAAQIKTEMGQSCFSMT
jgi:hypothetical protein